MPKVRAWSIFTLSMPYTANVYRGLNYFYLPKVMIQVQNGNGVLNMIVLRLKCMELAC